MKTRKRLAVSAFAMLAVVGMVAACTPPDSSGKPPKVDWSFKGTQVKVIDSQDCWAGFINCKDEPFLLNVAFRVTIGKKNSAKAWVVNNRTAAPQDVSEGTTIAVTEAAGGKVVFDGVRPVDVLDLLNNKLEIVGTYTWAAEEDTGGGLQGGAQLVADLLEGALNATIAQSNLQAITDTNQLAQNILDLLIETLFDWNGISGAFSIAWKSLTSSSFSVFGDLSDDALGGGLFIGIGARGTLADALNGLIGNNLPLPPVEIPLLAIPPSIQTWGLYTMKGTTQFDRTFTGPKPANIFDFTTPNVGGKHQWWMVAEKNTNAA